MIVPLACMNLKSLEYSEISFDCANKSRLHLFVKHLPPANDSSNLSSLGYFFNVVGLNTIFSPNIKTLKPDHFGHFYKSRQTV